MNNARPTITRPGTRGGRVLAPALMIMLAAARCLMAAEEPLLGPDQLRLLVGAQDPQRIAELMGEIESLGPRSLGGSGLPRAATWLKGRLAEMGFELLPSQPFDTAAPVDLDSTIAWTTPSGKRAHATVYAVWPNLVATPYLPPGGLTAPIIYAGGGRLEDFDGKAVAGTVVLLDYDCGSRWENAAALGAGAVIFLPDDGATFEQNMLKFTNVPLQMPRFYIDDIAAAARLEALARRGGRVTLAGGMAWRNVRSENVVALLRANSTDGARPQTLMLTIAYDSASVVPALACGGQSAANLAAALTMLETLAGQLEHLPRRQHLLVVFDGGRSMCNAGTRAFTRMLLDFHCRRRAAMVASGRKLERDEALLVAKLANTRPWLDMARRELEIRRGRLRAVVDWLAPEPNGGQPETRPFAYRDPTPVKRTATMEYVDARRWLNEYLHSRAKQQQIVSIVAMHRREKELGIDPFAPDAETPEEVQELRARKAYYTGLSMTDTPEGLVRAMRELADEFRRPGPEDVTEKTLLADLRAELAEVEDQAEQLRQWHELGERLAELNVTRQVTIDLSAGNSILTLERTAPRSTEWDWNLGPMISQRLERIVQAADLALGDEPIFDFIDSITFDASRQRRASPAETCSVNLDSALAGVSTYTLVTGNDPRIRRLGPGDRLPAGALAIGNLRRQAATLTLIVAEVLNNPKLLAPVEKYIPRMMNVLGKVVKRDIRSGPFPNLPVPGTVVVLPAQSRVQGTAFLNRYVIADRHGMFRFDAIPGDKVPELYAGGTAELLAFRLSPATGMVEYALDATMAARGGYVTSISVTGSDVFRRLVVFQGAAVQVYGVIDPRLLWPLETIELLDGKGGSIDNWYTMAPAAPSAAVQGQFSSAVAVVPPNSRIKLILSFGNHGNRMLLLGDQSEDPAGTGYAVGNGLNLTHTVPAAARQLWRLNDSRLRSLESKGVRSSIARKLHDSATGDLQEMESALENHQYSRAYFLARNIWGRELRAYPQVRGIAYEALMSVVILMAFLAPWAIFMERLTLRSGGIVGRVLGSAGFFAAAVVFLYFFHPAFQISATPIVIIIAYTLVALAAMSLRMITGKYASVMKNWRQSVGGVHSSDISRAGAFMVAFNLGLNNMVKRPLRTTLTIIMVTLLTFAVTTFTSVETYVDTRAVAIATDAKLPYDGVLFRLYDWATIPRSMAETFEEDLGPGVKTVRRMWYQKSERGWNIGLGLNKFVLSRADGSANFTAEALQGFMVAEREFSGIDRCVAGSWFSGREDEIILPTRAAKALGVTAQNVVGAAEQDQVRVRYGDNVLRVVGILNSSQADSLTDISGDPLSHVDFYASGLISTTDITAPVGDEVDIKFMGFDRAVLLPYALLEKLGGYNKTVVAKFLNGADVRERVDALMSRLGLNIYAAIDGQAQLLKTADAQSVGGIWRSLLPVLLVVLIVVNTMLGTVDERAEEIKMLGAVGLAPRHISFLYLAESCVYGVLGVVFGVFLGLVTGWATRGVSVGLNVNYASTSIMLMGTAVLVVVVLATLIPANRAAKLATPSGAAEWTLQESGDGRVELKLPFTVTRDNGVSVFAFIHEYLNGHWESTSPDFRCSSLTTAIIPIGDDDSALAIRGKIWLAPYDSRVAQEIELRLTQQGDEPLFEVTYRAAKFSGELNAWHRANFVFIDLLRGQMLIFRTLADEAKATYRRRAREIFTVEEASG